MSSPVDTSQAWMDEFQARFGVAPGSKDAQAELERCVEMCKELLAEREQLRAEVARLSRERNFYYHAANQLMQEEHKKFTMSKEEALALVGNQPPLAELIAELEAEGE